MGFRYRKSLNFGPFRVNVGTGGVGFSVGGRGFRTGVSGSGRRYSTFSLPGTGRVCSRNDSQAPSPSRSSWRSQPRAAR